MKDDSKPLAQPSRQWLFRHPAHFIAAGFGSGLVRPAPGTWGTLATFPFYFLAYALGGNLAVLALAVALFPLGVWAANRAGQSLGVSDHGAIVIDEIAAFMLVLAFTPHRPLFWALAFLAFRVFDIVKPWPVSWADRSIKGGFGVMLDDTLAAAYAVLLIMLLNQGMEKWL